MPTREIRPADAEEVVALRDRIAVLEKVVESMASYVPGFGSSGVAKARMSAMRQFPAQPSRFPVKQEA